MRIPSVTSMMVYRPYRSISSHRVRRRRFADYFLPPFLFIAFVVIIILAVQLYQSLFVVHKPLDIFLYTLQGRAKYIASGSVNVDDALNEMLVFKGDEIITDVSGRIALNFFRRELVRLDENSGLLLQEVSSDNNEDNLDLMLKVGRAWIFADTTSDITRNFILRTSHLVIESNGGVFEIQDFSPQKKSEIVRVIKGSVKVTVIITGSDGPKEVETIAVGEGQQFTMDRSVLSAYEKFQSPEVVGPIDSGFAEEEWYLWNNALDEKLP